MQITSNSSIFVVMKIANIVTTDNIDLAGEFNLVDNLGDAIKGIPTLIVGWRKIAKEYPNYDIASPVLEPNLYWIFKKSEDRDKFEEGLSWFTSKVYYDLMSKLPYVFIDPIQYDKKKIKKILHKITSSNKIISYHTNDMIYMYCDDVILGVDLKLLSYLGFSKDKIKSKINSVSDVFLTDDNILIGYKKAVEGFNKKARYMPYLHSISNE